MSALDRWREQLHAWAIPPAIVSTAAESPYGFPTAPFRTSGERFAAGPPTLTSARALEALPQGGAVLDVGCGGGASSLPLAGRAGVVVGIDAQEDMLEGFLANARAAGVDADSVHGRWPDVAGRVSPADVGVAGHVLYNVADLEPFVGALASASRRRVVLEMTERHPLHWMNDLWLTFHGVERPEGPVASDALAAIVELEYAPRLERWSAPPRPGGFDRRADAIALVRRRLCLDAGMDEEVAGALGPRVAERDGLWSAGPPGGQPHVTIWFDV